MTAPKAIEWIGNTDGFLRLLDQTRLPMESICLDCKTTEDVFVAIRNLSVRGAPAIGVSAGYGVVVGMQKEKGDFPAFLATLEKVTTYLAESRPTAVNLFWALDRMKAFGKTLESQSADERLKSLLDEAKRIEAEDIEICAAIGKYGAELFQPGDGILTHCNTGALATAGDGTAFSVLLAAHRAGKKIHVFADETRPLLQGARLTAWELMQRGIPNTLICDSMAAQVMKEGKIQRVIVGADRIASNGDAANKIGTYSVACLAKMHNIPFYVAAPWSTFDLTLEDGSGIPIEQRKESEITEGYGKRTAPVGVTVYNPAFDFTPAALIAGLVTETGVISPVTRENVLKMAPKK